jgi:hypothetical protein
MSSSSIPACPETAGQFSPPNYFLNLLPLTGRMWQREKRLQRGVNVRGFYGTVCGPLSIHLKPYTRLRLTAPSAASQWPATECSPSCALVSTSPTAP